MHWLGKVYTKVSEKSFVGSKVMVIFSFIPLACAECDDSLPFSGASSIPLLCNFSCHPSPPTIHPSFLTSSCHLFLGLPLNLVVPKFIYTIIHIQEHNTMSLDNDQLDAHLLYFTICPLQASTCFKHYMLIIRRLIALMQNLVSSSQWPSSALDGH